MSIQTSDAALFASRFYPVPKTLTYASNLTIDYSSVTIGRCTLTGNVTIAAPSNPTDGARLELWLNSSEGAWGLSFAEAIVIPTESTFTNPMALTSGKTYIVMLKYDAVTNDGQWELVSLVGGY